MKKSCLLDESEHGQSEEVIRTRDKQTTPKATHASVESTQNIEVKGTLECRTCHARRKVPRVELERKTAPKKCAALICEQIRALFEKTFRSASVVEPHISMQKVFLTECAQWTCGLVSMKHVPRQWDAIPVRDCAGEDHWDSPKQNPRSAGVQASTSSR